jgi:hypothetical protein
VTGLTAKIAAKPDQSATIERRLSPPERRAPT